MVEEAQLEETEAGLKPVGEGWFVVNARDARWMTGEPFGAIGCEPMGCPFASRQRAWW